MRVAICTSVSANIADVSTLTLPNKIEYCLKNDYSLIIDNQVYEQAAKNTHQLVHLFNNYDIIWTLDADTLITNMNMKIEELSCLGPHITVCEEGIVPYNKLNCGSIVWKNTFYSKWFLQTITALDFQWKPLVCGWQTWMEMIRPTLGNLITVAPIRSFNSCVWNKPGGGEGEPGSHWQKGDFVYHPCGVFPKSEKLNYLKRTLELLKEEK
jgi:hypothetical protein